MHEDAVATPGASFVKTSTGFSTGGTTVRDVALMRKTVGGSCKVKQRVASAPRRKALAMVGGTNRLGCN